MIGFLEGTVRATPTGTVIVTAGTGWAVHTPDTLADGAAVTVHVTTIVRETDISLYAFVDASHQQLFDLLLKAPGIGPAAALALLRNPGAAGVVEAILTNDTKALCAAKGVGAKAAAQIITSVKIPETLAAVLAGTAAARPVDDNDDLVDALVALGYPADDATRVISELHHAHPDFTDEDLIGTALMNLNTKVA